MRTQLILLMSCAAMLSGCNPAKTGASGASGVPAADAPRTSPAPAALDAPHRQPGLWEVQMSMEGVGGGGQARRMPPSQICIDKAFEDRTQVWAQGADTKKMCSQYSASRQADGSWKFNSTCNLPNGGVVTSTGVLTGDMATAYELTIESTTTGAKLEQMNGAHRTTMKARRVGECAPGQKGGDMIINGMTLHTGAAQTP